MTSATEEKLRKWAEELSELGNGLPDLDLFEWELEQEWDERAQAIWEYFGSAPHQLDWWAVSELSELKWLEDYFLQREDYEKCAAILRVQARWREEFPSSFGINKKKKRNHAKKL